MIRAVCIIYGFAVPCQPMVEFVLRMLCRSKREKATPIACKFPRQTCGRPFLLPQVYIGGYSRPLGSNQMLLLYRHPRMLQRKSDRDIVAAGLQHLSEFGFCYAVDMS